MAFEILGLVSELILIACVAGTWKYKWAKERTGTREGDTRGGAGYFQAPATQAIILKGGGSIMDYRCEAHV